MLFRSKVRVSNYIDRMFAKYAPATFLSLFIDDWFTFPIDEEDVKEKIGLNEQYEEYAIHDTDNFPIAIGEYVSIEELNEMYEMIEELPYYIVECLDEFISHYGTLEEVVEHKDDIYYYPDCETMTDVAYYESHWGQVKWTFYCHRGLVHKIFTKKLALNS